MKAILACTPSGGIGYQNRLPWPNLQGDLPRFRELTSGQTILMGRTTWDGLPKKPLPNRINLVLTSNPDTVVGGIAVSIPDLTSYPDAWVIGGSKLFELTWPMVKTIHLTRTFAEYDCDAFVNLSQLEREFSCWFSEKHEDHSYEIWHRVTQN